MRIPLALLRSLFTFLFGRLSWDPPKWLRLIARVLSFPFRFVWRPYYALKSSAPRKFRTITAVMVLLIAAVVGGAIYYRSLPEPHRVNYTLQQPEPTKIDPNSDGTLPAPNPLLVSFSGSASPVTLVGKQVTKGITIKPAIEGEWTWLQDNKLRFQPKAEWPVGERYRVTLEKYTLKPGVLLTDNSFEFFSPKFTPTFQSGEFYEDPTDPKIKQAVFTVQFTHPVEKSELERNSKLRIRIEPVKSFEDKSIREVPFHVNYNKLGNVAYLRSDPIEIPENDGEVLAQLPKGLHSARGGTGSESEIKYTVRVPGIDNYFKVTAVAHQVVTNQKTYEAEKVLTVETTAGVKDAELKRGLEAYLLPSDPKFYAAIPKKSDNSVSEDRQNEGCQGEGCDFSEEQSPPPTNNCPLQSVGQVSDDLLKNSKKIKVELIPSEHEAEKFHSLKYQAPDSRCLFVRVKKGTKAFGEYALKNDAAFLVESGPYPPDVQFMHEGGLLSITGAKKLSVISRNIRSIKYTLNRVLPGALNHLVSMSYGDFSKPYFDYNFGPENLSEVFEKTQTVAPAAPGRPSYSVFDFSSYLASEGTLPRGLFILEASAWNAETKSELGYSAKKLVLVSDLGFLVKKAVNGEEQVFVASLRTEQPQEGVLVQVLGKNGVPVFEGKTDQTGKVSVPSLRELKREKEPTVYVASKDGDLSFMPYSRSDRQLNFSRFDIGGLYSSTYTDSLQGFVFNDRGIYRPGEDARFGLLVKSNSWEALPAGTPFQVAISDPRGMELKRENLRFDGRGFEELTFNIPETALTGYYTCNLSLVKQPDDVRFLASSSFKVEEFQPDRLKISALLSSSAPEGWVSPDSLKTRVSLLNLFGTPAAGNTVKGRLMIAPASFSFPKFSSYFFYDSFKPVQSISEELGEVVTDEQGQAEFDLKLGRYEQGTYRVAVITEGFEKQGGRSVSIGATQIVSPLPYVVGVNAGSDRGYIKKGTKYPVSLIAVSQQGEAIDATDLELELIHRRFVSTLTRLENGSLNYQTVEKKESKEKRPLTVAAASSKFELPTNEPGDYIYEIRNSSGILLNKFDFSVVGDSNNQQNRESELDLKLAKSDFSPGEEIELEVRAPYTGVGLITIEKDKVYAHKWFKSETTSSIQKITLPENIEGNGYVNVSFVRSLSSPEIYVAPLSYGVKPFTVSRAKRTEELSLSSPERVIPGEKLDITVKTAAPARTVVYAVDEGILQVSKYKRPEPLNDFFQKRALEVSTSQILDQLLPEFEFIKHLSATGGDQDGLNGRYQNPFKRKGQKPVAYWSGLIDTGPNPTTLSVPIPDYYNGNVKIFAVSVSETKVGVKERATLVQGDIVITPTAPVAAAPGDQFEVGAIIANLRGAGDKVAVSLDVDPTRFKVETARQELVVPVGKEAPIAFKLTALNALGDAELKISAASMAGRQKAAYGLSLSIRPGSPQITTIQIGAANRRSGVKTLTLSRDLYPERSLREVSVSTLPIGLLKGLVRYLEKYPYGCSEQVTSQSYPAVALSGREGFGIAHDEAEKILNRALTTLASRQRENGGIKMWPMVADEDRAVTLHVARLIVEATDRGFTVDTVLQDQLNNYLRTIAGENEMTLSKVRERAYAIYLLTRQGNVTTGNLDTLREGLEKHSDVKGWREDIAALFMAASYSLLKLDDEAKSLRKGVSFDIPKENRDGYAYDELSHQGFALALYGRHFREELKELPSDLFEKITAELEAKQYTTMSSSQLILGLSEYLDAMPAPNSVDLTASTSEDGKSFTPLELPQSVLSVKTLSAVDRFLKFDPRQEETLYYQTTESGYDRGVPSDTANRLEVFREYLDKEGKPVTRVKLGDDITVRLVLRLKEENYNPGLIAVVDLYPSGLESASNPQEQSYNAQDAWYPQYVDTREERNIFFGYGDSTARTYSYTLKATTKGTFVVPPVFAEAMYDQSAYAYSSGGTITVE